MHEWFRSRLERFKVWFVGQPREPLSPEARYKRALDWIAVHRPRGPEYEIRDLKDEIRELRDEVRRLRSDLEGGCLGPELTWEAVAREALEAVKLLKAENASLWEALDRVR